MSNQTPTTRLAVQEQVDFFLSVERLLAAADQVKRNRQRLLDMVARPIKCSQSVPAGEGKR